MRKSTIFISAVLTTFALVMLYRVASAYSNNKIATQGEPTSDPAPTATESAAPIEVALGPVDAADLAAQVVGNTNLQSAESSNFNGVDAYMITFTNNDVVYVGMDGEILAVQVAPVTPVVINVAPAKQKNRNRNNGGNQSVSSAPAPAPSSGEDHDDHDDDHEEHDDD